MLIPAFANAGYCENNAQFYVQAAFWKIDGVPKEVALDRVTGLKSLFTDLNTGKNQTKEFTEMVDSIYEGNYFEKGDQDVPKYTNLMTVSNATILATCLAEHTE
ncbi:hypothetical protein SAMN05421733_103256 [Acinetobacter boissieri]|uniref:Uncharacterized protein n=2 Tax=Acinetobacter boissieri TaxID=1219383 RepID=A0A1G6H429_9GAMM|nr:hypothetical protein SAMN05421733_103256 [Acinetobacter boissieri]